MDGRSTILTALRRAPHRSHPAPGKDAVFEALTRNPQSMTRRVEIFRTKAHEVDATTAVIAGPSRLPGEIDGYLRRTGQDGPVRRSSMELLESLDFATGAAQDGDQVGLAHAYAGIAETGTLVLCSGPESPVSINFLPETHLVILPAWRILNACEEIWDLLRREAEGAEFMPPCLNWITGPSRTADIEQQLQLGVHGPRNLHILILEDENG